MTTYKLKPEFENDRIRTAILGILGIAVSSSCFGWDFNTPSFIKRLSEAKVLDLWFDKVEEPIMVNGKEIEFDTNFAIIFTGIGFTWFSINALKTLQSIPPETLQRIIDKLENK